MDKQRYHDICGMQNSFPVFMQPWWLDAVVGADNWDALVLEEEGTLKAVWPFAFRWRAGKRIIHQPALSQTGGIFILYPENQKYETRLSFEKAVCMRLIARMKEEVGFLTFHQCFHVNFKNWLPFYWSGFSQTTYYTYRIEAPTDRTSVINGMSAKLRNEIKKAERAHRVENSDSWRVLYDLMNKTYARQSTPNPVPQDLVERLCTAAIRRGAGRISIAVDSEGAPCCGVFCVEDAECVFYLIGGSDPDRRSDGANSLLLWTSIQDAISRGKSFDFEGSMNEKIEHFFRSFGGRQLPYMGIKLEPVSRDPTWLRIARFGKRTLYRCFYSISRSRRSHAAG